MSMILHTIINKIPKEQTWGKYFEEPKMASKSEYLPDDHVYVVASKQVKGVDDLQKWEQSEAYQVSIVFKYFVQFCQSTFDR